jgi:hypothetical protein
MSQGVRVIRPDRAQLRWDLVDLDSQLPDDHRARVVWAFVQGLDLGEFYDRIKARDAVAGRPASDPEVVLAVWLYATLEGDRRGAGDRSVVPAACGLPLAVWRGTDQSRSAGGISA